VLIATVQYFLPTSCAVSAYISRGWLCWHRERFRYEQGLIRISTMGLCIFLCIKGKIHLYSALYASSTQPCITDRAAVQPRPQPKPHSRTFICCHKAVRSLSLPFYGLRPRCPCKYLDYYSFTDPGGMEGWVGLVGWPIAESLPTKWSPVSHRLGAVKGTSAVQRPIS